MRLNINGVAYIKPNTVRSEISGIKTETSQRYRNHCQFYRGTASVEIDTTVNVWNITLTATDLELIFGNNKYDGIQAGTYTVSYANMLTVSHNVFMVLFENNTLKCCKYANTEITNDTPILFVVYADGYGRIKEIIGHETVLSKIKVNGSHWVIPVFNENTCSIFNHVVCVGDSMTSGHIQYDRTIEAIRTNPNYCWSKFLANMTGGTYVNLGISGATCATWMAETEGLAKAQDIKTQAYLVGLGANDARVYPDTHANAGEYVTPIGTKEDIGTTANTFYAQYSKLLNELFTISPEAHIFVQTVPYMPAWDCTVHNAAIREIVEIYRADGKRVHLLDLEEYKGYYEAASVKGDFICNHFTAIGYQQIAEILKRVWSEYINNHISEFQTVHLIEHDGDVSEYISEINELIGGDDA